jgi:hypothetical protein
VSRGPTPRRLLKYISRQLRLKRYLRAPGDGRISPRIPAQALLWAILTGQILRESSFAALENLVGSKRRRALGVSTAFGDDALGYFTERLDPAATRQAAVQAVRQAKRNKAFQNCRFLGLAIDGTTVCRCCQSKCSLCRPFRNAAKEIVGYRHHLVMVTLVGAGMALPLDVEPYGPGDANTLPDSVCYVESSRNWAPVLPIMGWSMEVLRPLPFCTPQATSGCRSSPA